MKTYDMVELAARNLKEAVLRNSLTTIGIAVGVASLVAMLSLGVGLQQMATRRLERSGLFDTVVVTPRVEFRGFGPRGRQPRNEQEQEPKPLDQQARADLAKLPGVIEVYPGIRAMAQVNYGGKDTYSMVAGLPMSARERDAFESIKGKFFSGAEAPEAILQSEFAKELDPNPESLLGKEISLRYPRRQTLGGGDLPAPFGGFSVIPSEEKLRVVGIIESDPESGFGALGRGRVYIPVRLAEKLDIMQISDVRDPLRSARAGYMSLVARVNDPKQIEPVEAAVRKMGFGAFSLLDATQQLRRFFAIVDLFLGIFGSVALVVASLGIVNTLVMAILERRREIGIMKAIGAGDGDVRRLFFAEAGVMGLVGGALGVALGWMIGHVINFGTNVYMRQQGLPAETFWTVPWWLVFGGIGFSILVSLAAGLYPAARAAKLDPVQSLRWE
jgi:putative ABC transport system permease protein